MTAPRIIARGATSAITRRTTLRKAFLAPYHPGVAQACLYALADAQRRTGVAVHHHILVINHIHLCVTPERDNLPRFLRLFLNDLSRSVNTLLSQEKYDRPGEVFDDRSAHIMRLCDAAAQSSHLLYEHLNCVAAGLVDRPEHMPGYEFDFGLWKRGGVEVSRPDFFFDKTRPDVLRLELTPPPLLYRDFDGDVQALAYHMKRMAEGAQRELCAQQYRAPLGARRLQRMHPWSEPRSLRETGGKRIPTFRIGARNVAGIEREIAAARETRAFRRDYCSARQSWAAGDRHVVFPYGTYQMRVEHGACVSAPPEPTDAIVCAPGPLLREIQAELDELRERRRLMGLTAENELRGNVIEQTRETFREEAAEICEQASDGMDFHTPATTSARPAAARLGNREKEHAASDLSADECVVVVKHRFDRPSLAHNASARRVVTHRDRRRGRPPSGKRGSDPPA